MENRGRGCDNDDVGRNGRTQRKAAQMDPIHRNWKVASWLLVRQLIMRHIESPHDR